MKKFLLTPTAAVAMTAHCQAADIRFIPPSDSYSPAIIITGAFESGDFAKCSVLMPTKSVPVTKCLLR